jgi:hypothetical protein
MANARLNNGGIFYSMAGGRDIIAANRSYPVLNAG